MQYIVYILFSEKDRNLYTGCTNDLGRRLENHRTGKVPATKNRGPLTLIHQETFTDKTAAFNRERFLKSLWGGRFKKKVRTAYLQSRAKSPPR